VSESLAAALARVPLFAGLEPGDCERLSAMFRELAFEAGSTLTRKGERGARVAAFFVITEGSARVEAGELVRSLGPGDHFGEIALLRDSPRTATVTAETVLRCLALSAWDFRTFVEERPAVALQLLETMSARLAELD
jgi:CRP-like cAMP-binding protein